MLIALRLVILEFPEAPENRDQFFLMGDGQIIGRSFLLLLCDIAVGVQEGVELVVIIVEGGVFALPAFCFSRRRLHHRRQIDHGVDASGALCLRGVVPCAWIEQVTATASHDQESGQDHKAHRACHRFLRLLQCGRVVKHVRARRVNVGPAWTRPNDKRRRVTASGYRRFPSSLFLCRPCALRTCRTSDCCCPRSSRRHDASSCLHSAPGASRGA